jgi:Flp pilus assembly protein TadD
MIPAGPSRPTRPQCSRCSRPGPKARPALRPGASLRALKALKALRGLLLTIGLMVTLMASVMAALMAANEASAQPNPASPAAQPTDGADALDQIERLLLQAPRNPELRFRKGVALAAAQRHAEAQAVFEKLIIDRPELPEPYNNLAVIRATQNDWEGARQVLVQAVQVLPTYALALENLGEVHLRLAEQAWAQAARIGPAPVSSRQKLALTRELLSRIAEIAPSESSTPRPGASPTPSSSP